MAKIYLMTYKEKNVIRVSHGIEEGTLRNICLSPEPLDYYIRTCGAKRDSDGTEYYIESKEE